MTSPIFPDTAMIFAAGLGKRMQPLTKTLPKPLIKVGGKPMIEYTLDKLKDHGIRKVVVNTHHLAELMEEYLHNYSGLEITCIREKTLLDTGGGLVNALPVLGQKPLFIINGDIIWRDDKNQPLLEQLSAMWNQQAEKKSILVLCPLNKAVGYDGTGDFGLENSLVVPPKNNQPLYVFTGIQIFDPLLVRDRKPVPFSLGNIYRQYIPKKLISGMPITGTWLHIGTPESIALAEAHL